MVFWQFEQIHFIYLFHCNQQQSQSRAYRTIWCLMCYYEPGYISSQVQYCSNAVVQCCMAVAWPHACMHEWATTYG